MIPYPVFEYYWELFETLNGIIIMIFSILDIYSLYKHKIDRAPLVQWALNLKSSKADIDMILIASVFFVITFLFYIYGSFYNDVTISMIADIFGTITYLLVSYVIVRWSRIFIRFIW